MFQVFDFYLFNADDLPGTVENLRSPVRGAREHQKMARPKTEVALSCIICN